MVAVIGAVGLVVASLIGIIPSFRHASSIPDTTVVIAGTVVDSVTNAAVGQATVSLAGRSESYQTEDNGNFRIEIKAPSKSNQQLRIRVAKSGYKTSDEAIVPPIETLIIPLQKL